MLRQIAQLVDGIATLQQLRGTHRGQLFVKQVPALSLGPWLRAVHHCRIKRLTAKIHPVLHYWSVPPAHPGAMFANAAIWVAASATCRWVRPVCSGVRRMLAYSGLANQVEYLFDTRVQRLALLGQAQPTGLAVEQRVTQMLFQPGNLSAHKIKR